MDVWTSKMHTSLCLCVWVCLSVIINWVCVCVCVCAACTMRLVLHVSQSFNLLHQVIWVPLTHAQQNGALPLHNICWDTHTHTHTHKYTHTQRSKRSKTMQQRQIPFLFLHINDMDTHCLWSNIKCSTDLRFTYIGVCFLFCQIRLLLTCLTSPWLSC